MKAEIATTVNEDKIMYPIISV